MRGSYAKVVMPKPQASSHSYRDHFHQIELFANGKRKANKFTQQTNKQTFLQKHSKSRQAQKNHRPNTVPCLTTLRGCQGDGVAPKKSVHTIRQELLSRDKHKLTHKKKIFCQQKTSEKSGTPLASLCSFSVTHSTLLTKLRKGRGNWNSTSLSFMQ